MRNVNKFEHNKQINKLDIVKIISRTVQTLNKEKRYQMCSLNLENRKQYNKKTKIILLIFQTAVQHFLFQLGWDI